MSNPQELLLEKAKELNEFVKKIKDNKFHGQNSVGAKLQAILRQTVTDEQGYALLAECERLLEPHRSKEQQNDAQKNLDAINKGSETKEPETKTEPAKAATPKKTVTKTK